MMRVYHCTTPGARPRFALAFEDEPHRVHLCCGVAAEWFLHRLLRDPKRRPLRWLECDGARLTPLSLATLNLAIRYGALRRMRFPDRRYRDREFFTWARLCRRLGLDCVPVRRAA